VTPSYAGISHHRLARGERLQWPVPHASHPGTPIMHVGQFTRGRGKVRVVEHLPTYESSYEAYPLLLTTGRVLYHWHGGEHQPPLAGACRRMSPARGRNQPRGCASLASCRRQRRARRVAPRSIAGICRRDRPGSGWRCVRQLPLSRCRECEQPDDRRPRSRCQDSRVQGVCGSPANRCSNLPLSLWERAGVRVLVRVFAQRFVVGHESV
jgi:hypothetical protein